MLRFFHSEVAQRPPAGVPSLETHLLGELADRTANDLCSASTMVRRAGRHAWSPDQHQMLDELASRLDALGAIQRLMQAPTWSGTVDLAQQLAALCQAMVAARYAEQNIALLARVEDVVLDAGQAWRMLMIVAELLAKAARHAFDHDGGTVLVDLFARDGAVVCAIRDDGRGQFDGWTRPSNYGSSVVHMLVKELGGRLETVPSKSGTSIVLTLPQNVNAMWTPALEECRLAS
jgi:two-component sensor histidine kinase